MSELYHRLLLWHKLVSMQTGGLALCSVRRRLNREEAQRWIDGLRNVADDIEAVLEQRTPILDMKGQRVVASPAPQPVAQDVKKGPKRATRKT